MDGYQAVEPVCASEYVMEMSLKEHGFKEGLRIDFQKRKPELMGYTQEWVDANGHKALVRVRFIPENVVACIVATAKEEKK